MSSALLVQDLAHSEIDESFHRIADTLSGLTELVDCDLMGRFWIFHFEKTYVLLRRGEGTRNTEANFFAAATLADAIAGTQPHGAPKMPLQHLQWIKSVSGTDGKSGWQTYSYQAEPFNSLRVATQIAGLLTNSRIVPRLPR